MTSQPILDELHQIREQLLAESGGTLAGLVARLQKEQEASGRIVRKNTTNKTMQQHGGGDFSDDAESTSSGR